MEIWILLKSHFKYSDSQRNGIFVLLFLIVAFQLVIFFADFSVLETSNPEKQKWLSLQSQIDSLKQQKQDYVAKICYELKGISYFIKPFVK